MSTSNSHTTWIIGSAGQVGTALRRRAPDDAPVRALTSADIDVTDPASVAAALRDLAADDVVINCSAYTDVDGAESDVAGAELVNAVGPGNLASATAAADAWLIHISTDYVFTGVAAGSSANRSAAVPVRDAPYEPDDLVDGETPATVYGATKLRGERSALGADPTATIVRTAWVYTGGADSKDFVGTMRRLERTRDTVRVVADQTGSPTYALDLADGLWELAAAGRHSGVAGAVLHATNAGTATWFDVASAVFAGVGAQPSRVTPCSTDEFPRPAPRPAYSVLSPASWIAAGLTGLRDWRTALDAAVTEDTSVSRDVQG